MSGDWVLDLMEDNLLDNYHNRDFYPTATVRKPGVVAKTYELNSHVIVRKTKKIGVVVGIRGEKRDVMLTFKNGKTYIKTYDIKELV